MTERPLKTLDTMAKVYEFVADGSEDIEALAVVDILRRGGVDIKLVSINDKAEFTSSHNVVIKTDLTFDEADLSDADLLLIPGGIPGATNLNDHKGVRQALLDQVAKGKKVGAICAGPMVLGLLGLLKGKRATCYPGFEKYLDGAEYTKQLFTVDGNVITGEGPAATLPYAYKILSFFVSEDKVKALQDGMMYTHLMSTK